MTQSANHHLTENWDSEELRETLAAQISHFEGYLRNGLNLRNFHSVKYPGNPADIFDRQKLSQSHGKFDFDAQVGFDGERHFHHFRQLQGCEWKDYGLVTDGHRRVSVIDLDSTLTIASIELNGEIRELYVEQTSDAFFEKFPALLRLAEADATALCENSAIDSEAARDWMRSRVEFWRGQLNEIIFRSGLSGFYSVTAAQSENLPSGSAYLWTIDLSRVFEGILSHRRTPGVTALNGNVPLSQSIMLDISNGSYSVLQWTAVNRID